MGQARDTPMAPAGCDCKREGDGMPKGLDLEAKVRREAARAVGSQFWT